MKSFIKAIVGPQLDGLLSSMSQMFLRDALVESYRGKDIFEVEEHLTIALTKAKQGVWASIEKRTNESEHLPETAKEALKEVVAEMLETFIQETKSYVLLESQKPSK